MIDAKSCTDVGMQIDASTVMWWMRQSDEARKAFGRPGARIEEVLGRFSLWVKKTALNPLVWGTELLSTTSSSAMRTD